MKKKITKALKIVTPLGIGAVLVWYSLSSATPEELKNLWKLIINADPFWVGLSLFIGLLSHISRAYRWQYLATPLGYSSRFRTSFMAVMVGYLSNLGIPRSGEFLRAVTLSNYEDIPFQKSLGTIITERVIDLIMLLLIVSLAFILNTEALGVYFVEQDIAPLKIVYTLVGGLVVMGGGFLLIKKLKLPFIEKLRQFVLGLYEGMLSVFKMKNKAAFIGHTIFIWIAYVLMLYVVKFSVSGISEVSLSAILMVFVAGSLAMMTSNGGFGAYPVFVGLALLLFGIEKTIGEAYGWIIWGSQTLMNLVFGVLSFILLPVFSKKK
ncbi:lysylphosphatidylglycerol synthase transmembrane domain-containing protein [Aquimarina agarilytica]|uniref:lysylphosphatidylglycerol synthase transmembrane domain-containing protein n=1 Tax=Aquimarina agarilytica TaxID=1087449 RepID=UPI00028817FE|nr:lysylphosphatidylglycerol synthase transmembrane domain-containing protein [Aquimarina agarilytica]